MFMLNMAVADFLMLTTCSVLYVFKQTVVFTLYLPGPVFCYMSAYLLSKLLFALFGSYILTPNLNFLSNFKVKGYSVGKWGEGLLLN